MRRSRIRDVVSLSAVALLCLAMNACASGPSDTPSSESHPSKGATSDALVTPDSPDAPTPTATVSAFARTCDGLATEEEVSAAWGGSSWSLRDTETSVESVVPGPVAQRTASGATESLLCEWSADDVLEGSTGLAVMRLRVPARDELVRELLASPEYTASGADDETTFVRTAPGGLFEEETTVYVFAGDLWLVGFSPGDESVILPLVERATARLTD